MSVNALTRSSTTKSAMQERWFDPDCEYARHVDPSSSYVPTGPSDIFAADRKTDSTVTPLKLALSVNNMCNSTKTNGHDPFIYKGQRVNAS